MAFNIFLPTGGNQAIDLGFAPGRNGKLDFSFGVRNFGAYGNGLYGGAGSNELGFSTRGGLYAEGNNTQWSPWGAQSNQWGANGYGSYNNSQARDVFGNYANSNYARNVFGYSANSNAGNVWTGQGAAAGSWGNAWGGGGEFSGYVPSYGARFYGAQGGFQARQWFGGGW